MWAPSSTGWAGSTPTASPASRIWRRRRGSRSPREARRRFARRRPSSADEHEPWCLARDRLGALQPQGYTRIGPALRHATACLSRVRARRRRLLLHTDGKPPDDDRYEGRDGMADVRQALREARAAGVEVHALAIDRRAREGLPAMFGPGGWTILPRPEALPIALGRAFAELRGALRARAPCRMSAPPAARRSAPRWPPSSRRRPRPPPPGWRAARPAGPPPAPGAR